MAEPYSLTLTEAAAAIRSKQLSPVELLRSILGRSEDVDPSLHAVDELFGDRAMAEARALEREQMSDSLRGPLHGIPFAIKDTIDLEGTVMRAGSRALPEVPADADAVTVSRLRAAGAIAVAKVAPHELAFGTITPKCRNPWDVGRYAGGSSGGSAVAVASGQSTFSLGTDTGGSVRGPASGCGLVGMRPSYGLVPRTGTLTNSWSLDTVGPLAHSTSDIAILMESLAGEHPSDPSTLGAASDSYFEQISRPLKGLRLGMPSNYFFDRVHEEVATAVSLSVDLLRGLGAKVEQVHVPGAEYFMAIVLGIQGPEISSVHRDLLRERSHLLGDDTRVTLEALSLLPARYYIKARQARNRLVREWSRMFESIDALVTPTYPRVAPPVGTETIEWPGDEGEPVWEAYSRLMVPASLVGCPAISVPCGLSSEGMPIGLQISGRPMDDATVMAISHGFENESSQLTMASAGYVVRPRRWSS